MVVYLDVLFAVNALMDGATLLAAARLGGVQVRKMRLIFLENCVLKSCLNVLRRSQIFTVSVWIMNYPLFIQWDLTITF